MVKKLCSRSWQLQRRSCFPLKDTIDKHSILSIADHKKVWRIEMYFNVFPWDERRMAHVYIHLSSAAVSSNADAILSYHVLKLTSFEPRDGRRLAVCLPLNTRRTGRSRFQRKKCPGIRIRGSCERHGDVCGHSKDLLLL